MLNKKISVVIPAYNEEKNILNTINETKRELEILNYDYEIIVVDDGSIDKTFEIVKNNFSFEKNKVRIEGYKPNAGKGNALKYGTDFIIGDYVLFMDADLDLHPRQISRFLAEMEKTNADVVIGSKKAKNSKVIYSFKRRFLSNGYYYFIKILFGLPVKDTRYCQMLWIRNLTHPPEHHYATASSTSSPSTNFLFSRTSSIS